MSGLRLLSAKTVRRGQRAHCSSPPHLGSVGFIQKATGQEDLIQSCDAPLQRGLLEQCFGKWNPTTATARAAPLTHTYSTHTQTLVQTHRVHTHMHKQKSMVFLLSHSSLANLAIVHSPMLSLTHTQTVTHTAHKVALTFRTEYIFLILCAVKSCILPLSVDLSHFSNHHI